MNYILFDGPNRAALLPFTYTRPVADIRIGILTIREKWELYLGVTTTTVTEDYLSDKYPMVEMEQNIMINASYIPNDALVNQIKNLKDQIKLFLMGIQWSHFIVWKIKKLILTRLETVQVERHSLKSGNYLGYFR